MSISTKFTRYLGTGSPGGADRPFTGFGLAPTMAWTHGVNNFTIQAWSHTAIQPDQTTVAAGAGGDMNLWADGFKSLDSGGLTLSGNVGGAGDNTRYVNDDPSIPGFDVIYYMAAFAGTDVAHGQYTGDGVSGLAITGLGWQPAIVAVNRTSANPASGTSLVRHKDMPANESLQISAGVAPYTQGVRSLDADGFTVGNNALVNANLSTYSWWAFREVVGSIAFGTYNGDATSERLIPVGGKPLLVYVIAERATGLSDWASVKYSNMPGINSEVVHGSGGAGATGEVDSLWGNYIQNFRPNGFEVGNAEFGSGDVLNQTGWTYYWMAIIQPAGAYSYVF